MLGTEPATDAMNEADTLLMVGTSFPYIEYLPKPGQARGIQIDIKPEKIGLRYPVELGLLGDSKTILSVLLPLLNKKQDDLFLKEKQRAMDKWINKIRQFRISNKTESDIDIAEKADGSTTDIGKPGIKPQIIASAVSEELETMQLFLLTLELIHFGPHATSILKME